MNRFKKITLFVTALAVCVGASAQKELIISGGSSVSSMVCSNNYVFVTGSNKVQAGTGTLGVGSSAAYVDTWTKVNFPGSETIQQVNSGSGQSFIALDCDNKVWCWGDNGVGQCGTGTKGGIVSSPVQVKAGCLSGTAYECGGNLCNVDVVYAGNANSFAILGDGPYKGYLVAWGGNISDGGYNSALGSGSDAGSASPVWCVDLQGNKMKNIVQIFSGDDVTLALDSDGHVWSCGGLLKPANGLGRLKAGGYSGDSQNGGPSNAFGMVYVEANKPLSNIVQIAAGDVSYFALDANGYIWSWGDSWNSSCGQGPNMQSNSPKRVVKGNTLDEDNDGAYLLAKQIGAGQSSGMAVSISGRPVTWGANPGQGSGDAAQNPGYVVFGSNTIHNDVILINKGDNWGFYGRSDGSMYAWGQNDNGQLGIGSTAAHTSAVKINPPSQCDAFKDPKPAAAITPKSMTVCASTFPQTTLDCGFPLSVALQPNYKITWYKDGVQVSTGTGANDTYKTPNGAPGIGKYKVVIEYVGSNSGCEHYVAAEDEIEISAYEKNFTPEGYFCGSDATVKVTPSGPTAVYTWHTSIAGTSDYGQTLGDETLTISASRLEDTTINGKPYKKLYVSETAPASGNFLTRAQMTGSATGTLSGGDNFSSGLSGMSVSQGAASFCTGFEVKQKVTINSVSYFANTLIQKWQGQSYAGQTLTATANVEATIIGSSTNQNGKFIPSTAKQYGKFSGSFTREVTVGSDGNLDNTDNGSARVEEASLTGSVTLEPGVYFIALSKVSSTVFQEFKIARESGRSVATSMKDDVDGTYIQAIGLVSYNNPSDGSGLFHDFKFGTGQAFCDVVRVYIPQDCPCTDPDDFDLVCTDASYFSDTKDTIVVCENAPTCTITTTAWAPSGNTFKYVWYKDGSELTSTETVANTSSPFSVTAAGEYKIKVWDKSVSNACTKEKSVKVMLNPTPTVEISGGGEICHGETLSTPVTFTMTGEPRFTVEYKLSTASRTTKKKSNGNTLVIDSPTDVVSIHIR